MIKKMSMDGAFVNPIPMDTPTRISIRNRKLLWYRRCTHSNSKLRFPRETLS